MIRTLPDRIIANVFLVLTLAFLVFMLAPSCTTEESTRSLRSLTITRTDGSGSFDLNGGWKTSDDVWRGGMGGDLDVHAWSIGWSPFAYLPDPDSAATRAALERVLRARETPYVETPARPIEPDPCAVTSTERPVCPACKRPQ